TKIAEIAKENDLQYVVFEKNNSNKVASIIQEDIGADKLEIHNLEVLSDEDIANNEDYLTLMKHNLEVLDQATEYTEINLFPRLLGFILLTFALQFIKYFY